MYSYIIGDLTEIEDDYIVIENNKIGYKIYVSEIFKQTLNLLEEYKIYTEFVIREDANILYGFSSADERKMFNMLTNVSSIGPKYAMALLSTMTVNDIKKAIISDDIAKITQAPGIGKKTASRIILELREKIEKDFVGVEVEDYEDVRADKGENLDFIREALLQLGYFKNDIDSFLNRTDTSNLKEEDIIKMAMKSLDSNR
ncbi:MAG: Holliday junction branch migration protein RuvA [Finegoldia sp.]|nr:Holliday junction branch migration protein RuvA [Finegoldia sp.]